MKQSVLIDILIIGSGPAGYSASIYAARGGASPHLLAGKQKGGQLITTPSIENWIGAHEAPSGFDLMQQMQTHSQHVGTQIADKSVLSIDTTSRPFQVKTESGHLTAKTIIIATGSNPRILGVPGEAELNGFGVSSCATCDGFFYRNKIVAVVGGGNTAVEEALYLANICEKIYLIHRRDSLRAEQSLQNQLTKTANIEPIWNQNVSSIQGTKTEGLSSVELINAQDQSAQTLKLDGLFVAIGHIPNTSFLSGQLQLDSDGYLITQAKGTILSTQTSVPGIFAAGDVADPVYRQAITSAGSGCQAALDALHFLRKK